MFRALVHFLTLAALVGALFAGCEKVSTETLVQRAEAALQDGQFRAAMLDLRTVLRDEPTNARARWLLSELYIAVEDGPSAEKELRRASELGVGDDAVLPLLAKALLLQGNADAVLEISLDSLVSPLMIADLEASRARAFIFRGSVSDAEVAVARALNLAPDSAYVQFANARTLLAGQDVEQTIEVLKQITESSPDYAPAWSLLGLVRAKDGDFLAAEESYTHAIDNRVFAISDRIERGFARLAQGKLVEAKKDVDELLKTSSGRHKVQLLSGLVWLQMHEFESAKEALELAYEKSPANLHGIIALATVDTILGHYNQGSNLAEKALALSPQNASARKLSARYALHDGDGYKAESLVSPVVERFPKDLDAKQILASSLMQQGELERAASLAKDVADRLGDSGGAQVWAGIALMAAGERDAGITALSRAAELTPEGKTANSLLVLGLMEKASGEEALLAASKYAENNPANPDALNLLAVTYLAQGDVDSGKTKLQQVLKLDPGNRMAARTLASLAISANEPESAREVLDKALSVSPEDARLLLLKAETLKMEGDSLGAERVMKAAIEANPEDVRFRVVLAKQQRDRGDLESAYNTLGDLSSVQDTGALALKAETALRLGLNAEAKNILEKLALSMPENTDVQFQLARVYTLLGNDYRAENTIQKLFELAPEDPRVAFAKAKILAKHGHLKEADKLVEMGGLPIDDPQVLSTRLAIATKAERWSDAVHFAGKLLQRRPSARNVVLLSRANASAGNYAESVDTLGSWLAANPRDVSVLTELAVLHQQHGENLEYLDQLFKILETDSANLYALNNLAWELRRKSPVEALSYAQAALEHHPESTEAMDTLAMVYVQNRDYSNALRFIAKAIDADPTVAVYRLHRAEIKSKSGDYEGAALELKELLREVLPHEVRSEAETLLMQVDGEASAQIQ